MRSAVLLSVVLNIALSISLAGCGGGASPAGRTTPAVPGNTAPSAALSNDNLPATATATLGTRAAAKGLFYGAAAKSQFLADQRFATALAAECSMLVPETELKWNVLRPSPESYDFSAADSLLAFAQAHNMRFRGHTLVWHSALPGWFHATATSQNAEQLLRSHIANVVGHYAGKVHSWDVVNEAVNPQENAANGLRASSPWYQLLGARYIEIAFRAAAEADPKALLVYNDYGLEYDTPDGDARREAVLRLLTDLKSSGTPIHALGIQAHLNGSETRFNAGKFQTFMSQVAALGLSIIITELDVRDQNLPADIAVRDRMVADAYSSFVSTVLSEPAVTGIVTWGLSDGYTWNSSFYPRSDSSPVRPLPLDAEMKRKPAWYALARAFDAASAR